MKDLEKNRSYYPTEIAMMHLKTDITLGQMLRQFDLVTVVTETEAPYLPDFTPVSRLFPLVAS